MNLAKRVKGPPRLWVLRGWLIILALGEMAFGLYPFWGEKRGNFYGDYSFAAFILLFISFLGFISLISGIFLFGRYKWAWGISFVLLVLITFILGQDVALWLTNGGGVSSFFQRLFGYVTYSSDRLLGILIMVPLIGTLIWMLIDRKNLTQR